MHQTYPPNSSVSWSFMNKMHQGSYLYNSQCLVIHKHLIFLRKNTMVAVGMGQALTDPYRLPPQAWVKARDWVREVERPSMGKAVEEAEPGGSPEPNTDLGGQENQEGESSSKCLEVRNPCLIC